MFNTTHFIKKLRIHTEMMRLQHISILFFIALASFHTYATDEGIKENLSHAEKIFHQGQVYYENDQYDEAINEFSSAVSLDSENSHYHHWLAKAYGELAEKSKWIKALKLAEKSRESLERAVALDPDNVDALTDLMKFYQQAPVFLGGSDQKAKDIGIRLKALQEETSDSLRQMQTEFDRQNG